MSNKPFIEIALLPVKSPVGPYILHGKFGVNYHQDGVLIEGSQVLKHVVMTITDRGAHQAITPFKEVAVFPDDINEGENACSGFFNINIFEHSAFTHAADYYVTCSIGMLVSNTIKVTKQ